MRRAKNIQERERGKYGALEYRRKIPIAELAEIAERGEEPAEARESEESVEGALRKINISIREVQSSEPFIYVGPCERSRPSSQSRPRFLFLRGPRS